MKLITWNINGLRAALTKEFSRYIADFGADFIAIQETKLNEPTDLALPQYATDWHFAERLGYSGTLCLYKNTPQSIAHGFGKPELDGEGRVITLEYPAFYLVNVYVPQTQGGLKRWYYRLDFDSALAEYAENLLRIKPVILCGDFNVAHEYIDIYEENTRNIENSAGFKEEERAAFDNLLSLGFVDAFRSLHPDERTYTWWANRFKNKEHNRGRRLDYFLVSENISDLIVSCDIISDCEISDHAPVELVIAL